MRPEDLVGRVFGVSPRRITDGTSNQTLAAWDSLGHVTLVLELEEVYGISLSAAEALTATDVGAIKSLLSTRGIRW